MRQIKEYKFKDMDRLLKDEGFEQVRNKGSHHIYKRGKDTFVLPSNKKGVKGGIYIQFKRKFLKNKKGKG